MKHEEDTVDGEVHHDSNKYIKSVYCQQSSDGCRTVVVNKTQHLNFPIYNLEQVSDNIVQSSNVQLVKI